MKGKLPVPKCLAFLVCEPIAVNSKTQQPMLCGFPLEFTHHVFPAASSFGFFARFTSAHGTCSFAIQLRNSDDEIVWRDCPRAPLPGPPDPLDVKSICVNYAVAFPCPGRYDFVFVINGEEAARQPFRVKVPESARKV